MTDTSIQKIVRSDVAEVIGTRGSQVEFRKGLEAGDVSPW